MRLCKLACLFVLIIPMALSISGCSVKVDPVLNSSLGIGAFENMGSVDVRDVSLALYIDPDLRKLTASQSLKQGDYSFDIGSAVSVKLIKGLAYKFRKISLVDSPNYELGDDIDALMRVELQDVDVNMGVKTGFSTVSTDSYTRLSIRAEIRDIKDRKIVWVGTTQAKETGSHQEMNAMTYQEAGRGFAVAIDKAIDKAIGDLVKQMSKSQNLNKYIMKWEKR